MAYDDLKQDNTNTLLIKELAEQKDLGVLITADLNWNQQVNVVCAKANRMLGFVKISSIDPSNAAFQSFEAWPPSDAN